MYIVKDGTETKGTEGKKQNEQRASRGRCKGDRPTSLWQSLRRQKSGNKIEKENKNFLKRCRVP